MTDGSDDEIELEIHKNRKLNSGGAVRRQIDPETTANPRGQGKRRQGAPPRGLLDRYAFGQGPARVGPPKKPTHAKTPIEWPADQPLSTPMSLPPWINVEPIRLGPVNPGVLDSWTRFLHPGGRNKFQGSGRPFLLDDDGSEEKSKALRAGSDSSIRHGSAGLPGSGRAFLLDDDDSFSDFRQQVKESKNPLGHKRYPTAYGYFNKEGKKGLQGPHTTAHIAVSAALEVLRMARRGFDFLLNTKIIPRPNQVRAILSDGLKKANRYDGLKAAVKKYVKRYKDLFEKGRKGDQKAIEKLIEANPVATYGWDKGEVSHGEIAGKGERRNVAVDDFGRYLKGESIEKLQTVDTSSGLSKKGAGRYDQLFRIIYGRTVLSEDSAVSEVDSEA